MNSAFGHAWEILKEHALLMSAELWQGSRLV
jgi:hypothetical protein